LGAGISKAADIVIFGRDCESSRAFCGTVNEVVSSLDEVRELAVGAAGRSKFALDKTK